MSRTIINSSNPNQTPFSDNENNGIVVNQDSTTTHETISRSFDGNYNNLTNLPNDSVIDGLNRLDNNEVNTTRTVAYINMIGQSNGDGTQVMPNADRITTPLTNVFHLTRTTAISGDAWTDESAWGWTRFTSESSENNLGFLKSGHWRNFTVEMAREWQLRIDNGENLPDLYLTHMSYSGNGFNGSSRYNPIESFADSRENIWTGSLKLHNWAINNLIEDNSAVIHLGINNNQWEHDGKVVADAIAYQSWMEALLAEHDKIVGFKIPFTYFVPSSKGADGRFAAVEEAKQSLENIGGRPKIALDAKLTSLYDASITTASGYLGIYHDDIHYKEDVFVELKDQWFTDRGPEGILITSAPSTDLSAYYTSVETNAAIAIATGVTKWNANQFVSAATNLDISGITYNTINTPASGWQSIKENDGKKYFRLQGRGSNYSFLTFEGLPIDTSFASVIMRLKQGSRISISAGFGQQDLSGSTFQNSGKEMLALGFYADTANGQLNDSSKYLMQVWRIGATAQKLSEVFVDNTGLPLGSGVSGTTADVDLKYSCLQGSSATQYTFKVDFKLINDTSYTNIATLTDVDVSGASAQVLGGGEVGLVSGIGDAFTDAAISAMRFKSFEIISNE